MLKGILKVKSLSLLLLLPMLAAAEINKGEHLNTTGQSKVNNVLAKSYLRDGASGAQALKAPQVNIGNHRAGNCTMNVGTTPAADKQTLSKKGAKQDVVVVSKDIINLCK